ncbi:hypothetical protein AGLY_014821 [Aphis glycines]|uniref:Uncharacterized protein n=1 Tax=Aphis glycines TaxID=307491 RepID=A0A6G0T4D5_APHGL|nr:hypothetical protein AGLY_014821 [Aphis glycines]
MTKPLGTHNNEYLSGFVFTSSLIFLARVFHTWFNPNAHCFDRQRTSPTLPLVVRYHYECLSVPYNGLKSQTRSISIFYPQTFLNPDKVVLIVPTCSELYFCFTYFLVLRIIQSEVYKYHIDEITNNSTSDMLAVMRRMHKQFRSSSLRKVTKLNTINRYFHRGLKNNDNFIVINKDRNFFLTYMYRLTLM